MSLYQYLELVLIVDYDTADWNTKINKSIWKIRWWNKTYNNKNNTMFISLSNMIIENVRIAGKIMYFQKLIFKY